ncbi:MAG: TatD family hydrolase [Candidatus Micrarchaeota archaeon]
MIDTHAHIDDKQFNPDRAEVLERAKQSEVRAVINPASSFSSNERALELSKQYKGYLFAMAGLFPTAYLKEPEKLPLVEQFIEKHKKEIIAIGEVGLDYFWSKTGPEREKQKACFARFIEIANETNFPIVIHARDSIDDCLQMLAKAGHTVIMHCFTGNREQAKQCVDRGYWVTMDTNCCFSSKNKSLIKHVSLDYLLAETDSPYNHPERKGRNEPANIRQLYELIAKEQGVEFSEIESRLDKNAAKAFKLW